MPPETATATVIPEQNVVSAQDTTPADIKSFRDAFGEPESKGPKESTQKAKDTPKKAPEKAVEASKEDLSVKGAKDDKASSKRWEKLGDLKVPEAAKEEEGKSTQESKDDSQSTESDDEKMPEGKTGQSRWMQLKAAEKELLSIKPSFDSIKKELDGYKTNGFIPEETKKRLENLEKRYANEILDEDQGFQNEVIRPINKSWKTLGDVAKESGLDEVKSQALENLITSEQSEVTRSRAIRRLIATGIQQEKNKETGEVEEIPLSDEDITTMSALAINAANDLWDKHWPKEAQYRNNAKAIADSIRGKDIKETESQKTEKESKYGEEAKRLSLIIKEKMPLVFEQFPDAMEAITTARPSTEIADQVFDAQSGHLVNFMARTINNLLSEKSKLEASLKARERAKPGSNDSVHVQQKKEDAGLSFEDAFPRR